MGPLAGFEHFLERLFERPSARLFGARLQPIQLQRRLERAMESARLTSGGRTIVPNNYEIHLSQEDWAQIEDIAETLAGELADACLAYARQRHYTLRDRPRVMIVADEAVDSGELDIETAFGRDFGRSLQRSQPTTPERAGADGDGASDGDGAADPLAADELDPGWRPATPTVPDHTMVFEVPSVQAPRARLRLIAPDGADRGVEVAGAPVAIGRATDNDLVIRDGRVSRHHARLQPRGGTLVLTDLGSTNGTRVNGVEVQEVALGEGDRIELGDSVLLVEAIPER